MGERHASARTSFDYVPRQPVAFHLNRHKTTVFNDDMDQGVFFRANGQESCAFL
jgi:hypothetical protein